MNKNYRVYNILVSFAILLSSCSTTSKINIITPPSATIHNNINNSPIGTRKGQQVSLEISDETYYPFLIAKDKDTGLNVPFGLNVHKKSHPGEKFGIGLGYTLASIGGGMVAISGLTMAAAAIGGDGETIAETMLPIMGVGGGIGVIGLAIGCPAEARLNQTLHYHRMAYDKNQYVSFEGLSTKLLNPDPPKGVSSQPASKKRRATSGEVTTKDNTDKVGSAAKRKRGDLATKVTGSYSCKGSLYKGSNIDEEYTHALVEITPIDKTHVAVRVIESDEDFFSAPLEYIVTSDGTRGYKLSIEGLPATITISKNGAMIFEHKKVNIDDEIYTLNLSGTRRK